MPRPSHYRRTKQYKRTCPVCGLAFFPTRSDARYDKPACRMAVSRAMKLVARVKATAAKVVSGISSTATK